MSNRSSRLIVGTSILLIALHAGIAGGQDSKPEPEKSVGEDEASTPPPWVITRRQFKRDYVGYLDNRRTHIYLLDVESQEMTQITSGDYEDVMAAVDDVIERGYADPDRLGVGGWSYGGLLTNHVITKSKRFKGADSKQTEAP